MRHGRSGTASFAPGAIPRPPLRPGPPTSTCSARVPRSGRDCRGWSTAAGSSRARGREWPVPGGAATDPGTVRVPGAPELDELTRTGDMIRALVAVAIVSIAVVSGALASTQGRQGSGPGSTDTNGRNIDEAGLARSSDGVLHVVWKRRQGAIGESIVHTPVSPAGKVGAASSVLAGPQGRGQSGRRPPSGRQAARLLPRPRRHARRRRRQGSHRPAVGPRMDARGHPSVVDRELRQPGRRSRHAARRLRRRLLAVVPSRVSRRPRPGSRRHRDPARQQMLRLSPGRSRPTRRAARP